VAGAGLSSAHCTSSRKVAGEVVKLSWTSAAAALDAQEQRGNPVEESNNCHAPQASTVHTDQEERMDISVKASVSLVSHPFAKFKIATPGMYK